MPRQKRGLAGVVALAGYVPNRRDELFAFAIFVNHHTLPNSDATALLDRILEEIEASRLAKCLWCF